jgi:hypothetical protein
VFQISIIILFPSKYNIRLTSSRLCELTGPKVEQYTIFYVEHFLTANFIWIQGRCTRCIYCTKNTAIYFHSFYAQTHSSSLPRQYTTLKRSQNHMFPPRTTPMSCHMQYQLLLLSTLSLFSDTTAFLFYRQYRRFTCVRLDLRVNLYVHDIVHGRKVSASELRYVRARGRRVWRERWRKAS